MSILNTLQTEDNSMNTLYKVPAGKRALVNVTVLGKAKAHSQIGVVPAAGTAIKQVSATEKLFTLKGEYPIGFVTNRKIYPSGIEVEASTSTGTLFAEQRFYLSSESIAGTPDLLHLKTEKNRIINAGGWTSASHVSNVEPSTYIDDPLGEVFGSPENVVLVKQGGNWFAVKTNGDAYFCRDATTSHAWSKYTSALSGERLNMAFNPDDYIALGGFYGSSWYVARFYKKSTKACVYVSVSAAAYNAVNAQINSGSINVYVMPYAFRSDSGMSLGNALTMVRRGGYTNIFSSPSNYSSEAAYYPAWGSDSNNKPNFTTDDSIRVVGIGHNGNFSVSGGNDYFIQLSDGSSYGASGTTSGSHYSSYPKDEALEPQQIRGVESFFQGEAVGSVTLPCYTSTMLKTKDVKVTKNMDVVTAFETVVPQADLVNGGDGHAAYRGILLGAGDELKVFSETAGIFTVTGSEETLNV